MLSVRSIIICSRKEWQRFSDMAFISIRSYLYRLTENMNVNNKFSSWENIFKGVLQGTILGPLFI